MKIIVTGASGLIGSALVKSLAAQGHQVTALVRHKLEEAKQSGSVAEVWWRPSRGELNAASLEGHDAAVHLAGESIAGGRWTDEKKRRIRDSRVAGTRLLAATFARLHNKPRTLVCASAVGYYGDRGAEIMTEESAPGMGFLSDVCREWEAAAQPARDADIRVVNLRFGIVLSAKGGALAKLLTPFKLGVGGKIGSGEQYMSWIALDDAVGVIEYALAHEELRGPVNTVAPHPVTNAEFTKTLGHVLSRPTILPIPAFGARLAFGEMADALLLGSTRVEPARLNAAHYVFQYPQLEGALRHLLE